MIVTLLPLCSYTRRFKSGVFESENIACCRERDLAIATGIASAGKSRLQRDVAVAYEEAGYRVIGAAVAGDAARTLGEEAAIEAGRDRLDQRGVLTIDEAGTLGAAQAKALFERARDAGARVHEYLFLATLRSIKASAAAARSTMATRRHRIARKAVRSTPSSRSRRPPMRGAGFTST